jgi:predicted flap endonuclease-1-like 5' DNA nuclease
MDADFAIAEEHGATSQPTVLSSDGAVSDTPSEPATDVPAAETPAATELTQIKGLGPKLAATLADLGITRIDQIAALSPQTAAELDAKLGAFQGRMARDRWIEQATLLAAGDQAGYESAFGKLGG